MGFEKVYHYPSWSTEPEEDETRVSFRFSDDPNPWYFDVPDGAVPALPFKAHGNLHHTGWDIPTRWAVDATGQVWADNAHGHPLEKCSAEGFVLAAERHADKVMFAKLVGLEPPQPDWYKQAVREGWTPPPGLKVLG